MVKKHSEIKKAEQEFKEELFKNEMRKTYDNIIDFLKEYLDMKERYYPLVALWIIGTYLHDFFKSYPYLFINAMRGSGKTLLLEIISKLSKDGSMLNSLTEAVLFRSKGTLCIDEFEGIMRKGRAEIRELLNSAYKKGTTVKRVKTKHTKEGEERVIEEFDVYRPIALANIWGMEEVLGDRVLHLTLEKSNTPSITKKQLNFSSSEPVTPKFKNLCSQFSVGSECMMLLNNALYPNWNIYIDNKYKDKNTTYTIHNTHLHTLPTLILDNLFNKIDETHIEGRNLELFFPLFIISYLIGDDVFEKILHIAKEIVREKKIEEQTESKDVMVIDFVSKQESIDFTPIRKLKEEFKQFISLDEEKTSKSWLSSEWFGRALKRLNLVKDKRRVSRGIEVTLDIQKAREKIKMFRINE